VMVCRAEDLRRRFRGDREDRHRNLGGASIGQGRSQCVCERTDWEFFLDIEWHCYALARRAERRGGTERRAERDRRRQRKLAILRLF